MCLAVPMKIISRHDTIGICEIAEVTREVNLSLVDAHIGDWVIVHVGFAIQKLNEEEALEKLRYYEAIGQSIAAEE